MTCCNVSHQSYDTDRGKHRNAGHKVEDHIRKQTQVCKSGPKFTSYRKSRLKCSSGATGQSAALFKLSDSTILVSPDSQVVRLRRRRTNSHGKLFLLVIFIGGEYRPQISFPTLDLCNRKLSSILCTEGLSMQERIFSLDMVKIS